MISIFLAQFRTISWYAQTIDIALRTHIFKAKHCLKVHNAIIVRQMRQWVTVTFIVLRGIPMMVIFNARLIQDLTHLAMPILKSLQYEFFSSTLDVFSFSYDTGTTLKVRDLKWIPSVCTCHVTDDVIFHNIPKFKRIPRWRIAWLI